MPRICTKAANPALRYERESIKPGSGERIPNRSRTNNHNRPRGRLFAHCSADGPTFSLETAAGGRNRRAPVHRDMEKTIYAKPEPTVTIYPPDGNHPSISRMVYPPANIEFQDEAHESDPRADSCPVFAYGRQPRRAGTVGVLSGA